MSKELKEGDIVVLKSGGPKMTIDYKTARDQWTCKWFDKDCNPQVDYYNS